MLALVGAAAYAFAERARLTLDPERSEIVIRGKVLGFAPATFRIAGFDATVMWEGDSLELERAEVRFSYRDLWSGRENLDERVRAWLEVERYPRGEYVMESTVSEDDERIAIGPLRLHGQERDARFTYRLDVGGDRAELEARSRIDYREWGLPPLRVLFLTVNPQLEIELKLAGSWEAIGGD